MQKRQLKKGIIGKFFLFIILVSFILFLFLYLKNNEKPKEPTNPIVEEPGEKPEEKPIEPATYLNKLTNTKLDESQIKLIIDFFDTYYKSIKELKYYDMKKYFVNPDSTDSLINEAAVTLLIDIRKLKPNDLKLAKTKYDLNIKDVTFNGSNIKITLLEDSYLNFAFMSDIESRVYNVKNEFTITKVNGEYKILNYNKVQDYYVMITDNDVSNATVEDLNKIKENYLNLVKKFVAEDEIKYQSFLKKEDIVPLTCDHKYDRAAALTYANKYVTDRNPAYFKYDDVGGNCQNYASQVLAAGGIPMDTIGSIGTQWKHYSSSVNENETKQGRSYSWTGVGYFYDYAKYNKGYGLCAKTDVNIYYAEAGDIIQVGTTSPRRHTLVVSGTIEKEGKLLDIMVNSNTVTLEKYPMSAYVYPYKTLIKVYGWNN